MKKYLITIVFFFTLLSCGVDYSKNILTEDIEKKLLDAREFALSNNIEEIKVKDDIKNDTIVELFSIVINKYNFKRFINNSKFSYFVMNGWKGSTYGILLTKSNDLGHAFYDLRKLETERNDSSMIWYFASSKVY